MRSLPRRSVVAGALAAGACALTACSALSPSETTTAGTPATAPSGSATASPSGAQPGAGPGSAPPVPTARALADWSLEDRVGQLLMVGVPAQAPSEEHAEIVSAVHAGGIFLHGRSQAGADATLEVVGRYADAPGRAPLLVSTDQEGGSVQVLTGPGLSTIPAAEEQARLSPEELSASAAVWAQELAAAGVGMNLAPCADLVDVLPPSANAPIGAWGRHYGTDAATVTAGALAFCEAMRSAGVEPVVKHFPGLGRVAQNTDVAARVVDSVTTRTDDAAVGVFAEAIAAGARAVMVSSATYELIDAAGPACFSATVVTDMLRGDLGFSGVVMSDDVTAAAQVQDWTPAERAVLAVRAGVDIVLASADASVAPEMFRALVAQARDDEGFAALVDAAVLRVLALKGVAIA